MIIGYLFLGFFGAVLSSIVALLSGYGILAMVGFYILGGCITTMAVICAGLSYRMASQPDLMTLKA